MLVAMSILSLIVVLVAQMLGGVSRAWVSGEQRVETYQNGRAILDLMSRDLAPAVISPKLQFVQSPTAGGNNVEKDVQQHKYSTSSSLYWQAALASGASGNVCEVGYFLDNTNGNYELKRLLITPDDTANYLIYKTAPTPGDCPWLPSSFFTNNNVVSTVSAGVLGIWIVCLDANGDPIPWYQGTVKYDSAANFQPPVPGQHLTSAQIAAFPMPQPPYTATTTARAHRLPSAVRITIVTLDETTLGRSKSSVPAYPQANGPGDIPRAIKSFTDSLLQARISSARTFSTVVKLANGTQ